MPYVAPRTGAWIETARSGPCTSRSRGSRPARARGLKHGFLRAKEKALLVAPHTGAWIETIRSRQHWLRNPTSRPARARGLKLEVPDYPEDAEGRAPHGRVD